MCSTIPTHEYQTCTKHSLSITLSVIADQWEDVRITTEMLLWGSPVHKKEEKVARKKYVKRCLKGTHTRFKTCLKALTLLRQPGLCCDTVLLLLQLKLPKQVFWNPQKVSRSGGSSLRLLLRHHARHWQHWQSQNAHPDATCVVMGCWAPWWKVPTVCSCQTGGQDSQKMENSRALCSFKLVVGSLCAQGYDKSHGTRARCQTLWHTGRIETIMNSRDIICFHVFLLCNSCEASLPEKKAWLIRDFKRHYCPHKLVFQGIKGRTGLST